MTHLFVVLALVVITAYALMKRAALTSLIAKIQDIEVQIDHQLQERYETFSQLINVMDKYMDIEKSTFREVSELQEKAMKAREEGDERSFVGDEDKISRHVEGVEFAFEQHEDLKSDTQAQQLFDLLVEQEGLLANLKLQCNSMITHYNEAKNSLFGSMITMIFNSSLNHNFELWHVNSDALDGRDKYQVEL